MQNDAINPLDLRPIWLKCVYLFVFLWTYIIACFATTITGQYFWVGAHPHLRRKIKNEMSEYFYNYMVDVPVVSKDQYPIGIRIDLHDVIQGQDLDNFIFVYRKIIHDILTAKHMSHDAIIEDDSKKYVQDIPTKFYPIEDHSKRKLKIEIYSINKW